MKKEQPKRLYRSRQDKIIAGVCGGIAEYFNVDPVLVRLAAVLLFFVKGIGLILYIVAWILIPENPKQKPTKITAAEQTVNKIVKRKPSRNGTVILGIVFIVIGALLLMKNLFIWFDAAYIWSIAIIALGVYLLTKRGKNEKKKI